MSRAHAFMLFVGHVEDGSNAGAILHHPAGFDTVEDGLEHLATVFRETAEAEYSLAALRVSGSSVCPHCGKAPPPHPIDPEDVAEAVRDFVMGVTNGHHELFTRIDAAGWEYLNSLPREELSRLIIVRDDADKILGDLAFAPRPSGDDVIYYQRWDAGVIDVPEDVQLYKETS